MDSASGRDVVVAGGRASGEGRGGIEGLGIEVSIEDVESGKILTHPIFSYPAPVHEFAETSTSDGKPPRPKIFPPRRRAKPLKGIRKLHW